MSFVSRRIDVKIDLPNGVFDGGGNSTTLTKLRCSMRIKIAGGASMSQVEGSIYGLPLSLMNQLSTVGTQLGRQANNKITVMAGDDQAGMALVYQGTLFAAYVDAQSQPKVAFRVSGIAGLYDAVKPVPPTSVKGSGDVATIAKGLAKQMGLQFENNEVNVKLSNPYLPGSAGQQMLMLARHAGIQHVIDRGTLAIWNPGQGRQGAPVLFSPQTGMIGYPAFNQATVIVKRIFDPTVIFGGTIQVQSDLTPACGMFEVYNVEHALDAQVPHGLWESIVQGTPMGRQEI